MLELLRARRSRLEMSLQLHKIFQEMIYVLDWMDEIKVRTLALECAVTSRLDCLVAPCQTLSAIDHDLSTASGCVLAVSCSPLLSVCSLQVISSFTIRSVASVSHRNHDSQSSLTHCFQPLDLTTFLVSHSVMQMNILCR